VGTKLQKLNGVRIKKKTFMNDSGKALSDILIKSIEI